MSFRDWDSSDWGFYVGLPAGIGLVLLLLVLAVRDKTVPDYSLVPPGYSIQELNGKYRWASSVTTGQMASRCFNDAARNAQAAETERRGWTTCYTSTTNKVEE